MDLTKNIIPKKRFTNLVLALLVFLLGFVFWSGYQEYQDLSKILGTENTSKLERLNFETKYLQVSKVYTDTNSDVIKNYVTVLELVESPSDNDKEKILESNFGFSKMIGLVNHPSFLITDKTESFWKSQIYLEFFYNTVGFLIIYLVFIILIVRFQKQNSKLFTQYVGKIFVVLSAFFYLSFFVDMIIYGRLMMFLNKTYYLGESITGGGSQQTLNIGIALFFIGIIIQQASTLQEEQDLTI